MAWAFAQAGATKSETGTTGTLSYPSSCTPGSMLVLGLRLGATGTNPTASDPTNGSWTRLALGLDAHSNSFAIFAVVNTASTALTVTLGNTTSVTRRWAIDEYTHGSDTLSIDTTGTGNGAFNTAPVSDAITSAADDSLIYGITIQDTGGGSIVGASSTTFRHAIDTSKFGCGDKVLATAGSGNVVNFTLGGNDDWFAVATILKFTAAAGGTTFRFLTLLGAGA